MLRNWRARLPAVLLLLQFVPSYATTVERLDLEDLTARSRFIVQGRVRGSETRWSSNGKLILTTTAIEIDESLKGAAPRTVSVTTIGGRIGNTVLRVAGMPVFTAGERLIVFLEESGDQHTVLGMGQGKFTITAGQVSNSVSELSFADGRPPAVSRMTLEAFKSEIRALVDRKR